VGGRRYLGPAFWTRVRKRNFREEGRELCEEALREKKAYVKNASTDGSSLSAQASVRKEELKKENKSNKKNS